MLPAGQVLVPTITRQLSNHESTADAYRLMRKGTVLTTGFGMGCLVGALVLSPYLIPLILGPGYEPSMRIMQIFGLMYPFAAFNHAIRSYVLLPLRQDSQILKATVVGAASESDRDLPACRQLSGSRRGSRTRARRNRDLRNTSSGRGEAPKVWTDQRVINETVHGDCL